MDLRFYTVKSFVTALEIVTAVLINGNSLDYKTDKDVIAVSCTLKENDTLKILRYKRLVLCQQTDTYRIIR